MTISTDWLSNISTNIKIDKEGAIMNKIEPWWKRCASSGISQESARDKERAELLKYIQHLENKIEGFQSYYVEPAPFYFRDKQGSLTLIPYQPGPEEGSGWSPLWEKP